PDRNRATAGASPTAPGPRFGEASPSPPGNPRHPVAIALMQLMAADPLSPPDREAAPLRGVYQLGPRLDERAGIERFAGHRVHGGQSQVVLLREPLAKPEV